MDTTIEVFFWRSLTEEGSPGEVRNNRNRRSEYHNPTIVCDIYKKYLIQKVHNIK